MTQAVAGIFRIVFFLLIGSFIRRKKLIDKQGMSGIKALVVNLAIPAVLFVSFSRLEINLELLPVICTVLVLNVLLFLSGLFIYKSTGSNNRLIPLCLSTMNFALLGLPLYEAMFGLEKLHHYTMFGVGLEIYMWFVFYFLFQWFLNGKKAMRSNINSFLKSPIIWSIILGCLSSIAGYDITTSEKAVQLALSETLSSSAKLAGPLIMIFIGYNISLEKHLLIGSLKLLILRLLSLFAFGYVLKLIVLDYFIPSSIYYDSAYFLMLSLPPVFSLPVLTVDFLEKEEAALLNNYIILHSVATIAIFSLRSLILSF